MSDFLTRLQQQHMPVSSSMEGSNSFNSEHNIYDNSTTYHIKVMRSMESHWHDA